MHTSSIAFPVPLLLATLLPLAAAGAQDPARLLESIDGSLVQAIDAARGTVDGTVVHAEIEPDGARVVFSIDFAQGTNNLCVVLDGKSKAELERERDADDHSRLCALAKVPLAQLIASAERSLHGHAIEGRLFLRGERALAEVRIFTDHVQTLEFDATTGSAVTADATPAQDAAPRFTDTFRLADDELVSHGTNPYFLLEPGHLLVLEGTDEGAAVRLQITVQDETRRIDGIETRIVEERESRDGVLVEVSRNFFAISKRTASLYYFGEEVDIYEGGVITSHDGAWQSGVAGAHFGLLLPGTPLLGSRYYQEVAPGVAMDRAEILALDETVTCGAGTFADCLRTEETTPLDAKEQSRKVYAPGTGLVVDGNLRLTAHGKTR